MLLDGQMRVLCVDRSLAGNGFQGIVAGSDRTLHEQLHPDCSGGCEFSKMWRTAWSSLRFRDSVEWEVDDAPTQRLLRLNLSRSPAPASITKDRRQRNILLAVTDITRHRREYQMLVENQQALIRLLSDKDPGAFVGDDVSDSLSDSGIRFVASLARQQSLGGRQLILAQENERKRIAAELHDGIAQTIGVIKFKLEACHAQIARSRPDLDLNFLKGSVDELKGLVDEIRRIAGNLAPSMLENFGLHVALDWLCEDFSDRFPGVQTSCDVTIDESAMPDLLNIAIYRVVQEALNNTGKHASASRVGVLLESNSAGVRLRISDDGKGFDWDAVAASSDGYSGLGLQSMKERVEATGGLIDIATAEGQGVVIAAEWPAGEIDAIRS